LLEYFKLYLITCTVMYGLFFMILLNFIVFILLLNNFDLDFGVIEPHPSGW